MIQDPRYMIQDPIYKTRSRSKIYDPRSKTIKIQDTTSKIHIFLQFFLNVGIITNELQMNIVYPILNLKVYFIQHTLWFSTNQMAYVT